MVELIDMADSDAFQAARVSATLLYFPVPVVYSSGLHWRWRPAWLVVNATQGCEIGKVQIIV